MANITVLDDKTINQIAAGEVVERPVSVVKELVENSIDSGADYISVEIKDGGISLIRVTDNGSGIDKNNIKTAFLRHATSKIKNIEDLVNITSLGFRGEALSSISAVSQVELLTKVKGEILGYRYVINGGKEMSLDEAGIPDGTTFIIRNLFYNTPARRKFLKSPLTEGNYITELMERLILSHPNVAFRYIVNGKEKLSSAGNGQIKDNIYSIFGRDMAHLVIPVSFTCENIKIEGFIGKPETGRGNRNFELFFVNNRCIKSKILSKACEEAYSNYLMMHKYPFVVLYFYIPGELLDVNVHPAKTEIRFLDESNLYNELLCLVNNKLSQKELIPEVYVEDKLSVKSASPATSVGLIDSDGLFNREKSVDSDEAVNLDIAVDSISSSETVRSVDCARPALSPEPFETDRIEKIRETFSENNNFNEEIEVIKQETLFEEKFLSRANISKHRIVGQVFDTYWIIELDSKMYIIDQHAAHEKVLYERFKKRIDQDQIFTQSLSPSIIVSLTGAEIEIYNKYKDNFSKLGFEVEHFGGKEYVITGVPVDLFGLNEKDGFLSVLDELSTVTRISDLNTVNDRIATMACKAAIKGNMRFSIEEASELINELLGLDNPYNCPHGRPTIISYSKSEIEKLFKRIV